MTIIQADFGKKRTKSKGKSKEEKAASIYQFHVSLVFSDPLIWRRILVPGQLTLKQFHAVLQHCMGWTGEHNHQFYVGKIFYNMSSATGEEKEYDEAKYDLQSLEEAMKWCFTYIYDAGDGWEHEILLEETKPPDSSFKAPVIVAGERAAPPEDIGSVHVYEEILSALENPGEEKSRQLLDYHELLQFEPSEFDYNKINAELQKQSWFT